MSAQALLFTAPHIGTRWRVTRYRGAYRIWQVDAIDAEAGEFTMKCVEDTTEGPERYGVGFEMSVELAWFTVRGELPVKSEGAVRPI